MMIAGSTQLPSVCLASSMPAELPSRILSEAQAAPIINLSSAAGQFGFAMRSPYSAAKWGVIGLTKTLAIELGEEGIRVNAIPCPALLQVTGKDA